MCSSDLMTEGKVQYSIVYEEVQPEEEPFPWRTTGLVILAVGIAASAGVGLFYLVLFGKKRKAGKVPGDPYADRPKMHRPEMLQVMDRGLEDDRR